MGNTATANGDPAQWCDQMIGWMTQHNGDWATGTTPGTTDQHPLCRSQRPPRTAPSQRRSRRLLIP